MDEFLAVFISIVHFCVILIVLLYLIRCQKKTRKDVFKINHKVNELVEHKENNIQVVLITIVSEEIEQYINRALPEGKAFGHYIKKKIEDISGLYKVFREHFSKNKDLTLLGSEAFKNSLLGSSKSEMGNDMPEWVYQKLDALNDKNYNDFIRSLSLMHMGTDSGEQLQIVKNQLFISFRNNIIGTRETYLLIHDEIIKKVIHSS